MHTKSVTTELEAAIAAQLEIIESDSELERAVAAFTAVMAPAMRAAALTLAEQAAAEVTAQLADQRVDVVLEDSEPLLTVHSEVDPVTVSTDELEARITVRLPRALKDSIEAAAAERGESANSYVVRTLAAEVRTTQRRAGRSLRGTIRT